MIRGEIWWADLGIPFGSESGFRRPVIIVQEDAFNKSKIDTVIVIPLTSNMIFENAPGNVFIGKDESGLSRDSIIVVPQIGVIDKDRLIEKIIKVSKLCIEEIEYGIKLVLAIK